MKILGISAFYHDSAAALVVDGDARRRRAGGALHAQEARRRVPRARRSPTACGAATSAPSGVDAVVYYDKPITTFVRLLKTYLRVGPKGIRSFSSAMPAWTREKLWIPYEIERGLRRIGSPMPKDLWFTEHHESHAASAFFPSPFEHAAILTFDGVGEWATSSVGVGRGNHHRAAAPAQLPELARSPLLGVHVLLRVPRELRRVQADGSRPVRRSRSTSIAIFEHLVDLRPDGSFRMEMKYFNYLSGLTMTNRRFADAVRWSAPQAGVGDHHSASSTSPPRSRPPPRRSCSRMARAAAESTGERNACLAGGVALNCVANGSAAARRPVREPLDPARRRRRRRRGRSGALRLAPDPRQPPRRRRGPRPHAGCVPRAALQQRRDRGVAR